MTSMKRRIFLKGSLATGAIGIAASAGLLTPRASLAAWSKEAFEAKDVNSALSGLFGSSDLAGSDKIKIKAPDIAENGAVVPVNVSSTGNATQLAVLVEKNPGTLAAQFFIPSGTIPNVTTRIKMGQTSNVYALAKIGDKWVMAVKEIKVTLGGCGG